jgi:hypothetical protein
LSMYMYMYVHDMFFPNYSFSHYAEQY